MNFDHVIADIEASIRITESTIRQYEKASSAPGPTPTWEQEQIRLCQHLNAERAAAIEALSRHCHPSDPSHPSDPKPGENDA